MFGKGENMKIEMGIIIILCIVVGILLFRLWCYHRQINHITKELSNIKKEDTNYRLSSYCAVGKTEKMIDSVNQIILNHRDVERNLKNENRIYKESITGISHDIRTPLTSAKGYLQMLQKKDIPDNKKREYIQIVERRLDDVSGMLNQLFEYARIETGELQLECEVLNATKLFTETISMFYDDFLKKSCEPEVDILSTPCYIKGDKQAFTRIVENLIKNALVHGLGEYRLSFAQEKQHIIIRVSNRTDSIERKDIDRIFDRFYTTDQSRSRKTTGLGLAIVKRFTEQMGGIANAFLEGDYFTVEVCIPMTSVNY